MHLQNNTFLQGGKYKIVRFIASGGFGCTYEAWHSQLDARIALKEFFVSDFCNRDEATGQITVATQSKVALVNKLKKKFTEEARALFKMKHPGIVQVIDIFEENGTAYYAMEFIEGKSLNEVVKQRGKLPEAEAVGYVLQVAEALKYVHSLNRLHLDLKPGNIMLNKEGKAVIIDFGASKHYDTETGENTSTLLGVNTKGYAPVEQVNQSFTTFSPATDIYALGATLYKLLTGITPPPSTVLHAEEATLTPLPSNISASTRQAVNAAMQLLRKNRPQTIEEWVNTFRNNNSLQEDEKTEYNDLIKPYPQPKHALQPTPQPKPQKKKWLFLSAIVTALVVSCIIGVKFSHQITEKDIQATGTINGHGYVDLGLSVKWATCNVGANSPSDYGDYFAWGETSTKAEYTTENCKTAEIYISDIAGKPQYDVARANWGSSWRLPTMAECNELINKCTWTWTTQNRHEGYEVTSTINGNSIFLPAAGWRGNTSLNLVRKNGYYWSSTPFSNRSTYRINFDSFSHEMDWRTRGSGFSVRPVSE